MSENDRPSGKDATHQRLMKAAEDAQELCRQLESDPEYLEKKRKLEFDYLETKRRAEDAQRTILEMVRAELVRLELKLPSGELHPKLRETAARLCAWDVRDVDALSPANWAKGRESYFDARMREIVDKAAEDFKRQKCQVWVGIRDRANDELRHKRREEEALDAPVRDARRAATQALEKLMRYVADGQARKDKEEEKKRPLEWTRARKVLSELTWEKVRQAMEEDK